MKCRLVVFIVCYSLLLIWLVCEIHPILLFFGPYPLYVLRHGWVSHSLFVVVFSLPSFISLSFVLTTHTYIHICPVCASRAYQVTKSHTHTHTQPDRYLWILWNPSFQFPLPFDNLKMNIYMHFNRHSTDIFQCFFFTLNFISLV